MIMLRKNSNNYLKTLFVYWVILFAWQNLASNQGESLLDLVVKIGLLGYFVLSSVKYGGRRQVFNASAVLAWLGLASCFIFNFFNSKSVEFFDIKTCLFTLISVYIFVIYMGKTIVSANDVLEFCNYIIGVDLFLVIYCVLFCPTFYVQVFSINSAYGNELRAFMSSSHEFAMYMAFGVFSSLWGIKYGKKERCRRIIYCSCIVVFGLHIFLSFSRTTMLACGVAAVVFLYAFNKKAFWGVFGMSIVLGVILLQSAEVYEYIFRIVLKGNTSAGRGVMYKFAWEYFKDSSLLTQLFGIGISNTTALVRQEFNHGSFHCAYLQTLVSGGIGLFSYLISAIFLSVSNAKKAYKVDKFTGAWATSLAFAGMFFMLTNTAVYFYSPIDSYLLTVFCVVVPMYISNNIGEWTERKRMEIDG